MRQLRHSLISSIVRNLSSDERRIRSLAFARDDNPCIAVYTPIESFPLDEALDDRSELSAAIPRRRLRQCVAHEDPRHVKLVLGATQQIIHRPKQLT
jgi:hypothetical protein